MGRKPTPTGGHMGGMGAVREGKGQVTLAMRCRRTIDLFNVRRDREKARVWLGFKIRHSNFEL